MTRFGKWLNDHERSRPEAAAALGLTRQYVCMLSAGSASPGLKTAYAIEYWTRKETPADPVLVASWPVHAAAAEPTPLGKFLTLAGITREEAARALGWTNQKAYNISAGVQQPSHEEIVAIEAWTKGFKKKGGGVRARDWKAA